MRLRQIVKLSPLISTIDGNSLRTHAVYRITIRLWNDSSKEQRVTAYLIGADISDYNLVLGMAWLSRHNPDVMWRDRN